MVEAVGPDCERGFGSGDRVAIHPLSSCGHCYPCRIGRGNVCDNFSLIGIHEDGGLQELLRMPEALVFADERGRAPRSPRWRSRCRSQCARSTARRLEAGEHVVIFGAGPIGQAICLLARERARRC